MTFESVFQAIHGYKPFPWQSRAASQLLEGSPFDLVKVPTASGKTAMIDAAIFSAAHGGPRRIAFIIDRRVVVDEAYSRANRMAEALSNGRLPELAKKLGPVQVVRLRGGVYGDDDWVLYPERVTVIVSTVDQVGSRLLHRGYGVSPRMAPMHAGFVGNDALYIVDEAHLSTPFIETLEATRRYGADVRLVAMTATPIKDSGNTVGLSQEDHSHPILVKRLRASKKARLIDAPGGEADFVKLALSEAEELSKSSQVIGIVVNRVSTARRIHQALLRSKSHSELLIGRVRPHDADRLMKRVLPDIKAGRSRNEGQEALFIVATQTIEVGADLDFDALITEAASLDALRQRFGRLDRLGELGDTRAAVVYRQPKIDSSGSPVSDPIYGMAVHDTWNWLNEVSKDNCVDFGVGSLDSTIHRCSLPAALEPTHAPALLPTHIELLSQTGPEAPAIDISSWLHGAGNSASDVSIVWRADLDSLDKNHWADSIRLFPPLTNEALEVPIYAVRQWLEGRKPQEVTDLEGAVLTSETESRSVKSLLRWRGADNCEVVFAKDIRPGDTLVVPSNYGGCDRYGWDPDSKDPVKDIAEACSLDRGRGHFVRLIEGLTSWLGALEDGILEAVRELVAAETQMTPEGGIDEERVHTARSQLLSLLEKVDHPYVKTFGGEFRTELHPLGVVLRGRVLDEVNATIQSGVPVELDRHLEGTFQKANEIAGLHTQRDSIANAARLHDLGKSYFRFQSMLYGSPVVAAGQPCLAKSGLRKLSEIRSALAQSGLPKGYRHELASLAFSDEHEPLVRYLTASHHGYGRPWFPVCADPDVPGAAIIELGSGWIPLYIELLGQYGPWALAGMELLLRASDARQSIAEQEEGRV